jgi:hypothetical protein
MKACLIWAIKRLPWPARRDIVETIMDYEGDYMQVIERYLHRDGKHVHLNPRKKVAV